MEKIQEYINQMQNSLDEIKKFLEPKSELENELGNEQVKSIKELVIDTKNYFIPRYQRGYKWDKNNVKVLLDDIAEFLTDEKIFYCLQPIIVLCDKGKYNILDGQQRLTTFYILCKFLGLNPQSEIKYETREKSIDFLKDIKASYNENKDNIDFYFMQNAINAINEWFEEHKKEDEEIKNKIAECLKNSNKAEKFIGCIWYEVEKNNNEVVNETDIFSRVNSGKIPLTNAELVKARILNIKNFEDNLKATQSEIANEWDAIEYDLQNDDFFGFLVQNNKKYTNRIELLFEIYCKNSNYNENGEHAIFEFINKELEKKDNIDFWKKIKNIYLTLKSWFNEPELYNLIGFMLNIGIENISNFYENSKDKSKIEFKKFYKDKIKEKMFKQREIKNTKDIEEIIDELYYENKRKETQNILLLFNIISYEKNKQKFSFARYNSEKWSLEHIHAQNENPAETITDDEKRVEYIKLAKESFGDKLDIKEYKEYKVGNKDDKKFNKIVSKIYELSKISEDLLHSIGNLVLLDCANNSALRNHVFFVKRDKIKKMDMNGEFIPICTKNAFMKYYSNESADNFQWTEEDFNEYKKEIINSIVKFFEIKGVENEQF